MSEYIERGALIAFVRGVRQRLPKDSKDFFTRDEMLLNFQQYIECQKAEDVEPVVRGEWKEHPIADTTDEGEQYVAMFWQCSNCHGKLIYWNFQRTKFCPDCGARMMERSGSGE